VGGSTQEKESEWINDKHKEKTICDMIIGIKYLKEQYRDTLNVKPPFCSSVIQVSKLVTQGVEVCTLEV